MIKILFVCHGNICRSTMAESVFTYISGEKYLSGCFEIASAATSREEIGNPVDRRTVKKLEEKSIPSVPHRAVQMTSSDCDRFDFVVIMDEENRRGAMRIAKTDAQRARIVKLLDFVPGREGEDVSDPWYTHDFETAYNDIREGCEALLEYCIKEYIQ